MSGPRTTVSVHIDYHPDTQPGAVAVLLDLLASARVRATWSVPLDTDPALGDRLFFSGHSIVEPIASAASSRLGDDPIGWLHDTQIAVGRALEQHAELGLRVETSALDRAANIAAVAEALDLVAGLARAGRVRIVAPSGAAAASARFSSV